MQRPQTTIGDTPRKSYQQCPVAGLKKREGKKRNSPCTPYREKGKGKENSRVFLGNLHSCARSRVRRALDAELDIAMSAFRGTEYNRRTWAAIAWRVGIENFHYALLEKLNENKSNPVPFKNAATAFQAFLDRRFPKGGAI